MAAPPLVQALAGKATWLSNAHLIFLPTENLLLPARARCGAQKRARCATLVDITMHTVGKMALKQASFLPNDIHSLILDFVYAHRAG